MSNNVQIDRNLEISGVVVAPENIRQLAINVYDEYKKDLELEKKPHADINFILRSFDGTQYRSDQVDFMLKGGLGKLLRSIFII